MVKSYKVGFEKMGVDLGKVVRGKTTCPSCSASRTKSSERCFSINHDNGTYFCHHCGISGRVDSDEWIEKSGKLVTTYEVRQAVLKKEKKYIKPKDIFSHDISSIIEYLSNRGISDKTANKMRLGTDNGGNLVFRYYFNDRLVAAKSRSVSDKKFWQIPDCKPILYNLNNIVGREVVIICEGEFDTLSWVEAGFDFAVSLDKGTPAKGQNPGAKLDCLRTCVRHLEDKEIIYLSMDSDEPGQYLKELLIDRFGVNKVLIVPFPSDCKDANDVLVKYGKDKLRDCFNDAYRPKVADVTKAEDVWEEIEADLLNGEEKGDPCHLDGFTDMFSWIKGFLYLWTGKPNHGKSEFLKFLLILKSAYDGWKWAVFTPEHAPAKQFYKELIRIFTGKSLNSKHSNCISLQELQSCKEFINDHFIFIFPDENEPKNSDEAMQTPDWMVKKFRQLKISEGIDGVVIDPWNQLDHILKDFKREDLYLSHWLKKLKQFGMYHSVAVNIVAHPKTMEARRRPNAYDLSGGAMWNNKADFVGVIDRPRFYDDKSDNSVDVVVEKAKKQYMFGRPGELNLTYDIQTGWYFDEGFKTSSMDGVFEKVTGMNRHQQSNQFPGITPNKAIEDGDTDIPF